MIARWATEKVISQMRFRRGVHLTGARQVGKTTLVKSLEFDNARRYTLDDAIVRQAAVSDPGSFTRHGQGETLLIDEVQKVPELLDAIKMVVDDNSDKGQYLLTGSSNLRFAKAVRDSLAGRLGHVRLRPLALGEINGNKPSFLDAAFSRGFSAAYPLLDKRDIIHIGFTGGYPEPLDFPASERREWCKLYLDDLLEKDIKDVTEIRKTAVLRSIALWLLARSSQFFTDEEMSAKAGVAKITAQNYVEALEALFLFDRVPAWAKSDYELVGKRPKWIAADSGLMAGILGWNEEEVYFDERRNGKFVETWVYQQLSAIAGISSEYSLWQYRDGRKREIDFIVERDDGALLGVEVKSGRATSDDFKHLKWFGDNLATGPFTGVVLYSGKDVLHFGENLMAVPLSALGE